MKKLFLSDVDSPQVELECGGHIEQICAISNVAKNFNFDECFKTLTIVCCVANNRGVIILLYHFRR